MKFNNKIKVLLGLTVITSFLVGCSSENEDKKTQEQQQTTSISDTKDDSNENLEIEKNEDSQDSKANTTNYNTLGFAIDENNLLFNDKVYKIINVDGGDRSGKRQNNVAVNIGFGDRTYWALTNDYGQLVHVLAENIVLQNDNTEPVNSSGRYYDDEANVPGTEHPDLDQGHIIADSLGGVANAYNITPQDSTLNRHGDQAYMEKVIRDAGGCTNFKATISYPNENTQTPSKYKYEYVLKGNEITDEFDNKNPEKNNTKPNTNTEQPKDNASDNLSNVDTNGNGKVTIKEAKAAGFKMPISKDHWLYKYMDDRDGDGLVGE
ncbi:MAG: DNA/RNA non-specific endonuclease [Terrisporobacter sp.]